MASQSNQYSQRKFVLGVDLDGVVADFYGGLKPIVADWFDRKEADLPDTFSYGLPEWGLKMYEKGEDEGHDGYQKIHRHAVMERDLFKNLQPVPGAPKALRALSDNDIRIRIITHRLYIKYTHKVSIQQTVEWLDRYGIPYWDICFMKDKAAVGANLYIEDSPDNVRALLAEDLDVVVFTNPTNKDIKPPLLADRANTWSEAEALVLGRLAKWKEARGTV